MANTKSSKKDLRRVAKRTEQNKAVRTSLKTFVKKAKVATATGDIPTTQEGLRLAQKALDKASQNGVIHPNQAARRKSRIAKAAVEVLKGNAPVAAVVVKKAVKKAAPKKAAKK